MVAEVRPGPGLPATPLREAAPALATAAELIVQTVGALSRRSPSIVAAAAEELGSLVIGLHFDDGSEARLRAQHDGLVAESGPGEATVQCLFSEASLQRIFDLEQKPADVIGLGELDARGSAEGVVAAWRTFQILSQRAAGLRYVQGLWNRYRRDRGLDGARAAPPATSSPWPRPGIPDAAALLRGDARALARTASVASTRVLWDGKGGAGWWTLPGPRDADLNEVLEACRRRTADEIAAFIGPGEPRATLYDLMRDYPSRGGKGLRPTLCMATCAAFGGEPEDAVRISAAVEMFHNAFLIHDDIEDESESRRGDPCMHVAHGVGLAVNAGDGLNLMAVDAVLSNIDRLGLARTLALMHETIRMCRETIEGQAIELGWIRNHEVPPADEDYFHMVTKKTGWYTCISPCRLGAIAAGHTRSRELDLVGDVFHKVGIAFQIQDDMLNLVGEEALYGKESLGDLLEGKRTVMLIHLMRSLAGKERGEVAEWLTLPRTGKTFAEARWLLGLMEREGSLDYGRKVSADFARLGTRLFAESLEFLPESESKAILRQVAHYVTTRDL
ncbi:polyprenyl synthetase family protein [Myxococcota bacterium]|nr:polyprenyl synthetase family protein [Myxococcota bacterium]